MKCIDLCPSPTHLGVSSHKRKQCEVDDTSLILGTEKVFSAGSL